MRDEEYEFYSDCREKKSIANSAFKRRTHCGKGGRVRLPSDNMSKKELEAMNGPVESYPMNRPVSWQEFKVWPEHIQTMYIKLLWQKFNVSSREIARMMGVDASALTKRLRNLGIGQGAHSRGRRTNWDSEGWYAWCGLAPRNQKEAVGTEEIAEEVPEEIPVAQKLIEEIVEETLADVEEEAPVQEKRVWHVEEVPERKRCIPTTGNMVFEGLADDVLETIRMLLGGAKVHISVTWDVVEG